MSNAPKDDPDANSQEVKPIDAPAAIELHPKPNTSARVSKRAGFAIGVVVLALLTAFAYGGYRRQIRAQAAARETSIPSAVAPATASANEVIKDIPVGNASTAGADPNQLQALGSAQARPGQSPGTQNCGFDPQSGQPYRFSPETGQPCTSYPHDPVVVRQPPPSGRAQTAAAMPEPT